MTCDLIAIGVSALACEVVRAVRMDGQHDVWRDVVQINKQLA